MTKPLIGTPVNRVDGHAKVSGGAKYAADNVPRGVTYGHLVLSTISCGTVRSMDVAAALAAPGVLAVYTPFHPLVLHPQPPDSFAGLIGERQPPLQDTGVRYRGQIIGLVVAETIEQARDAAWMVSASYQVEPAKLSFEDGLPDAEELAFPPSVELPSASAVEAAWAASPITFEATYTQPAEHHNAMELHAAVAQWHDGVLTIHSPNHGPRLHAIEIATALGVELSDVRVLSPHVGGGFGGKATTWGPTILAAAAIANAVHHATGKRIRDLPITLEKLL